MGTLVSVCVRECDKILDRLTALECIIGGEGVEGETVGELLVRMHRECDEKMTEGRVTNPAHGRNGGGALNGRNIRLTIRPDHSFQVKMTQTRMIDFYNMHPACPV